MTQQASGRGENGAQHSGGQSGPPSAPQGAGEATITDPVCARPVPLSSPHTFVFNGALFCFCSGDCRMQFVTEPARYVRLEAAAGPGRLGTGAALAEGTQSTAPASTVGGAPESRAGAPAAHLRPAARFASDSGMNTTLQMEHGLDAPNVASSLLASAPTQTRPPTRPPTRPSFHTPTRPPTRPPTTMTNVISVFEEKHGSTIDTANDRALALAAAGQSGAAAGAGLLGPQLAVSNAGVARLGASAPDWLNANRKTALERARELIATPLALWRGATPAPSAASC